LVLMIRGRSGIRLTEDGKLLYSESKDLFERFDELKRKIRREASGKVLRLAASENLCIHIVPLFVKRLLDLGMASTVDLFSGTAEQIEARVSKSTSDFGLFYNPARDPWLRHRVLGEVEFKLVFPKGSGRKDLSVLPFVGSRVSDYSQPYFALRALHQKGIRPSRVVESNSQEAQLRMTMAGVGYTVIPKFLIGPHLGRVSVDSEFSERSKVHCVYRNAMPSANWELLKSCFDLGCAK